MKPYYSEAGITIYHGNCVELLPALESVQLCLTDPPFGVGFAEATWADRPQDYPAFMKSWLEVCRAETFGVFQAAKQICNFHQWFPAEYRVFAACRAMTQWRPIAMQYKYDPVVIWGNPPLALKHFADYFEQRLAPFGANRPLKCHPCARPYETTRYLVAGLSLPGSTILDPFMGSGTTLRAAKDLGRKAIGIEIEEKYCEIAAKRMSQSVLDFGSQPVKSEQTQLIIK